MVCLTIAFNLTRNIEGGILLFQASHRDKRPLTPKSPHFLSEPFRPRVESLDQARPTVLALIVQLNRMAQVIVDHTKMARGLATNLYVVLCRTNTMS